MALDNFPALSRQYTLFLDRGLKWGSLNSYYGAYSLARAFEDEKRGEAVIERLIHDKVQSGNYGLAGRITSISANIGIRSIFEAADTYERFMMLAEHGELPAIRYTAEANPKAQPKPYCRKRLFDYLSRNREVAAALIILGLLGIFAAISRNPPKVSYNPDKVPVAATYPNTPAEKFLALTEAGWVYDGNGHFKRIVEDGDNRGVSGIVDDAYRKLGSKTQMDAERAALLADEIIHTEGSQVKRKGKKGNMGDLRNPKKNIIKEDAILRAHVSVLSQLFN